MHSSEELTGRSLIEVELKRAIAPVIIVGIQKGDRLLAELREKTAITSRKRLEQQKRQFMFSRL